MPRHSRSPSHRDSDSGHTSRYTSGNTPYSRDRYLDGRRSQRFDDSERDREGARSNYNERRRDDRRREYNSRRSPEERDRRQDRNDERDRDRDHARDRPRDRRRSASPPSRSRRSESPVDKTKPIFTPSGLLAAATKTVTASDGTKTVLKYHEPPEARRPVLGWRLYVFKGDEQAGESLGSLKLALLFYSLLPPFLFFVGRATPHQQAKRLPYWEGPTCGRHCHRPPILLKTACRYSMFIAHLILFGHGLHSLFYR
jgi:hypothetical protein